MPGQILIRGFMTGALQTGMQFGAAFAQVWDRALELLFPFANVGIDLLLMSKIESNRPINLLQGQRREVLADGLRRVSGFERINE